MTDLLLEFDDKENQHYCFKIALVEAICAEDEALLKKQTEPEESNFSEDESLKEIRDILDKID